MHQSGHSRAQSMHEVQFSSSSAMTPRLRGGRSGATSGYSAVWVGRSAVRAVVDQPLEDAGQPRSRPTSSPSTPPRRRSAAAGRAPSGTSQSQASRCSWSSRRRGQATRTQMTTTATTKPLSRVHSQPRVSSNGPCQPPSQSVAKSSDITTMPAYSASRKKAKRSPVYSVQAPMTSSASATGMSNGGRCSSAHGGDEEDERAGQLPQHPPRRPAVGERRAARASRRPAPSTRRRARSAARTTRAGRRRAGRRAGRTCWRWPSRPSGCRGHRPRWRRARARPSPARRRRPRPGAMGMVASASR